jgi:hypothetical protein
MPIITAKQFGKHPRLNVEEQMVRLWAKDQIIPRELIVTGPSGRNRFRNPDETQVSEILARLTKKKGRDRIARHIPKETQEMFKKSRKGMATLSNTMLARAFLGYGPDIVESLLELAEKERAAAIEGTLPIGENIMSLDFAFGPGIETDITKYSAEERFPSRYVDEKGELFDVPRFKGAIGFPSGHPFAQLLKEPEKLRLLIHCRRAARKHGYINDTRVAAELGITPKTFRARYKRSRRFMKLYSEAKILFTSDRLTIPIGREPSPPAPSDEDDDRAFITEETTKGRITGRGTKKPTHYRNTEEEDHASCL